MGTILIVASQTVRGPELSAVVRERQQAGSTEFFLLVPQPPPPAAAVAAGLAAVESVAYAATVSTLHEELREVAETRLVNGLDWLESLGVSARGETGPSDAVGSAVDLVDRMDIDEIIVSTLPSRISKWLRQDLPSRLGRQIENVPITVVTAADLPDGERDDVRVIIRLEEQLLDADMRGSPERLGKLLHPEFVEIGKSGSVYIKEGILESLAADPGLSVDASGYEVSFLAEDVALVTYGISSTEPSLRSSIWVREGGAWLLRFHQGTRTAT